MDVVSASGHFSTVVQLAVVFGSVSVIFLFACSRQASGNFTRFLRELRAVNHPSFRGRRRKRARF